MRAVGGGGSDAEADNATEAEPVSVTTLRWKREAEKPIKLQVGWQIEHNGGGNDTIYTSNAGRALIKKTRGNRAKTVEG